jgi:hypothetical protein
MQDFPKTENTKGFYCLAQLDTPYDWSVYIRTNRAQNFLDIWGW